MKKKIMLVEDNAVMSKILRIRLEAMGYEMVNQKITTGEDAIKYAMSEDPDLILMDIGLPGGMDGVEAANEILKYRTIPILYETAYPKGIAETAVKDTSGISDYILKPVEYEELDRKIQELLAADSDAFINLQTSNISVKTKERNKDDEKI